MFLEVAYLLPELAVVNGHKVFDILGSPAIVAKSQQEALTGSREMFEREPAAVKIDVDVGKEHCQLGHVVMVSATPAG